MRILTGNFDLPVIIKFYCPHFASPDCPARRSMKAYVQSILAIFLILVSYGDIKGSELDYSTTQIRTMWYVCSSVFRVNYPRIPEQLKIVLCDCYVNHLREKYSAREVLKLNKEESGKLGAEVAHVCKIPELIIINIPSSIPKGAT